MGRLYLEVILHEDGTIDFLYQSMTIGGEYFCGMMGGIEDSSGGIGLSVFEKNEYGAYCFNPVYLTAISPIHFTRMATGLDTPLYRGSLLTGNAVDFIVPIRNNGDWDWNDCYDLSVVSTWAVDFFDENYYTLDGNMCTLGYSAGTGNVYQADTFKVIVRVYLDVTVSGDQATVGLTATSKNDPTVSETTFLTVASPAPFLQAFNDTQQSAMVVEYIRPNANFTMNAGQPNNFQSWSPSVAKGPNGYVYAWMIAAVNRTASTTIARST